MPRPEPQQQRAADLLRAAAWPLVVACAAALTCYLVAGPSLGFLFGGIAMATFLTPPLVAAEHPPIRQVIVAAAVVDGVGLTWLLAIFAGDLSLLQWLQCYMLLAAYVAALATATTLLICIPLLRPLGAAAIVTTLALLWLTWPIWLAPWLHGPQGQTLAGWLIAAHPLLAVNGIAQHLGIWSQQALAYRVMNLGQDISYTLPTRILPAAALHVGITVLAGGCAWLLRLLSRRAAR
jgi:hypothetical protein